MLADAFGVELLADGLAHQALTAAVELDPAAIDLVHQFRLDRRAVAQLELQHPLGPVLVRPVHQDAGGVEAAQAAGAGQRLERIFGQLLLGDLAGVMAEDQPGLGRDGVAQRLHPLLQEEQHGGVVVLALAVGAAVEQVADRIDDDDVGWRIGKRSRMAAVVAATPPASSSIRTFGVATRRSLAAAMTAGSRRIAWMRSRR